ncbi:MAG: acyltransferase family protein, partial [Bacteroidota bacterium]
MEAGACGNRPDIMKSRVFGLDLLRSFAMISVIAAHSGYDTLLGLRHGIIAVESFFVMSGFLIGEMLIRDFREGFDFNDLKSFWIKRWFRTLPLYYAVLILKFIFIDQS